MSNAHVYPMPVDRWVRETGKTRKGLAASALLSTSTLFKARAQHSERVKIHWTSAVMIATRMRLIPYGELVTEDDPSVVAVMGNRSLISNKGSRAHNWWG